MSTPESPTERSAGAPSLDKGDPDGQHHGVEPVDALPDTGPTDSHQTMDPGAGKRAGSSDTITRLTDAAVEAVSIEGAGERGLQRGSTWCASAGPGTLRPRLGWSRDTYPGHHPRHPRVEQSG